MQVIIKQIDELIEIMDHICQLMIESKPIAATKKMPEFTGKLMELYPKIIESYLKPEFEQVREDMTYWTNQLDRMLHVLQGDDVFLLIDVLHFETRENLLLYRKMIEGMSAAHE